VKRRRLGVAERAATGAFRGIDELLSQGPS